ECVHALDIAAVEGLSCTATLPDSVRFDRETVSYMPDPVPLTVTLRNVLESAEHGIEAVLDTAALTRLRPAAGEAAERSAALLDAGADIRFDWLLRPIEDEATSEQQVTVWYRTVERPEWSACTGTVVVDGWPRESGVWCETGGHDTLHADQ